MVRPQNTVPSPILSGWKDIARYLGKGIRTVQRYELELGLPIRRPTGKSRASVIATTAELDAWVKAGSLRRSFALRRGMPESTCDLDRFRAALAEHHRLLAEVTKFGREMHHAMEVLRANLLAIQARKLDESAQYSARVPLPSEDGKGKIN